MDSADGESTESWSEDICPICRISLVECHEIASPNRCAHKFCVSCLETWSQTKDSCPICRIRYDQLQVSDDFPANPPHISRVIDVTSVPDSAGGLDELQVLTSLQQLTAHISSLTSSIQEARAAAQVAQQAYSALQAEVSALRAHVDELRVVSAQLQTRVGELHNAIARTHDDSLGSHNGEDNGIDQHDHERDDATEGDENHKVNENDQS